MAECMWDKNELDNYAQKQAAMGMCIVISGYFGGLQGKEIGKGDKGAMMKDWKKSISHKGKPFIPLMLVGAFKIILLSTWHLFLLETFQGSPFESRVKRENKVLYTIFPGTSSSFVRR